MKKKLILIQATIFWLNAQEFLLDSIQVTSDTTNSTKVEKDQSSSSISANLIEKYTINSTSELGKYFPSLKIYAQGSDTFPLISYHGISGADFYSSILGLYIDGIPQSPNFLIQNLFDIEEIKLINGSEGLLYGENAPLGLIAITSKNPIKKPYATISTQASILQEDINLQVGGTLLKDKLWGKVSFRYLHDNGFIKDFETNKFLNSGDSFIIGGGLYYQPSENILLNTNYSFYHTFSRKDFYLSKTQLQHLKLQNSTTAEYKEFDENNIQNKILNKTPFMRLNAHNASFKLDYFIDHSSLSLISAFQKSDTLANEYPGVYVKNEKTQGYYYNNTQLITEAKIQTTHQKNIESLFGIYYKYLITDNGMRDVPTEVIGYNGTWDAKEIINTVALYANATIPLKKWVLHTGLRYQVFHHTITSINPPVKEISPYQNQQIFQAINPRISLFYHYKPISSFFLQFSNSTKPGGFAKFPFADTDTIPYHSEQFYSIEFGNKTTLLDKKLQIKTSIYTILRTNTQSYVGNGYYKSIKNLGNAYALGLDLELKYTNYFLETFINLNLGDSRFFKGGKNIGTITILGNTGKYNLSHLRPKYSPLLNLSAGIDFYILNRQNHFLSLSTLLHFSTPYYLDDLNHDRDLIQKAFALLDLSLNYKFYKRYKLILFTQNITNTRYITTALVGSKGKAFISGNPINVGAKFIWSY